MHDFRTPPAEIEVDEPLVRRLLAAQAPAFAEAPIAPFASGWDNALFRVGPHHLARIPRRALAVPLIENEQLVLPAIARFLPRPVPAPVVMGRPLGDDYPWPWSLVPWIEGTPAADAPLNATGALQLAEMLASLHDLDPGLVPDGVTPNPVRGVPVARRQEAFDARRQQLATLAEPLSAELLAIWERALAAPPSLGRVILQGDPHARNVLTAGGELSAMIDWGDVTLGDPASDLACFWMLVDDASARRRAIDRYVSLASHADMGRGFAALLARSKGWALTYGAILGVTGLADHPTHARMGLVTLRNLAEDAA
ncbi:MAG: aminoglycoside phosphotransferase family protein [Myxococcales bacterium]|nr:aminoglycoside phosphotransferase family protein [Myxococcales bacterium]